MKSAYGSNNHAYPARGSLTGLLPAYSRDPQIAPAGKATSNGFDGGFS